MDKAMDTKKILIIEDDMKISNIVCFNLTKEGYKTIVAGDGGKGLELALTASPDLVLLDLLLPTMHGFEVCKKIREESNVPIIILTSLDEEVDVVLGLELGADDYIKKPFSMRELIARVKANIRRTDIKDIIGADPANVKEYGSITIDLNRYEARKHDQPLDLTLREFELLKYLVEREDKVYSREHLLEEVWNYEYYGDIRTVDVTIRRLREKLEDDSSNPKYVLTKRGVGYYFHRS